MKFPDIIDLATTVQAPDFKHDFLSEKKMCVIHSEI